MVVRAALARDDACDPLIQHAKQQRDIAAERVPDAADTFGVDLFASEQIVNSAHTVPCVVLRQVLAGEQQQPARQDALEPWVVEFALTRAGIPVMPAFALPDRVEGQHGEPAAHQIQAGELMCWVETSQFVAAARSDHRRERSIAAGR